MFHWLPAITRRLRPPQEVLEGYEQPELIELTFRKTLSYLPECDLPEIADAMTVLDFGGGCGIHHKQARSPDIRWAVVDTPGMVARAAELATERLQFFSEIAAAAAWLGPIDVMHSNGAVQYTPDPASTVRNLCSLRAAKMVWDRLALSKGSNPEVEVQSSYLSDNGPGRGVVAKEKLVRYRRTLLPELDFLAAHEGYYMTSRGPDWFRFQLR